MIHSRHNFRFRIATIGIIALTFVIAAATNAQATGVPNCNTTGATTPCFEPVWVNGHQVKMTFVDLNPMPSNPSDVSFYVLAPQTGHPQGGPVPFFHDHVTSDTRPDDERDLNIHYRGFLVFCSAQGISSGACVPTMTSFPQGLVPLAKTINGHRLTSVDRIESGASSGLLTLVDTGAVFSARLGRHR
jgi:hypothetical protein